MPRGFMVSLQIERRTHGQFQLTSLQLGSVWLVADRTYQNSLKDARVEKLTSAPNIVN